MKTPVWNDENRYSQTGYSAPTIWPMSGNYTSNLAWAIDYAAALKRENAHQEWLDDEEGWHSYTLQIRQREADELDDI